MKTENVINEAIDAITERLHDQSVSGLRDSLNVIRDNTQALICKYIQTEDIKRKEFVVRPNGAEGELHLTLHEIFSSLYFHTSSELFNAARLKAANELVYAALKESSDNDEEQHF